MAVERIILPFLWQLLEQSPSLLVYLIGLFGAYELRRRYPRPCALVMMGTALAFVNSVASSYLSLYFVDVFKQNPSNWPSEKIDRLFSIFGVAGGLVHALTVGLLLTATIVGRRPAERPEQAVDVEVI